MKDRSVGPDRLPQSLVTLYEDLFAMQTLLSRYSSENDYAALNSDFRTMKARLVVDAGACDADIVSRRRAAANSPTYDARRQVLAGFCDTHIQWGTEARLAEDFLSGKLFRRVHRASTKSLDRNGSRNRRYEIFVGDAPLSEVAKRLSLYSEYQQQAGRNVRFKRSKTKRWQYAQLKLIKVMGLVVADCIDYTASDTCSRGEAMSIFSLSFAMAVGASAGRWKPV